MNRPQDNDHNPTEKIYLEAGHWVRLTITIVWSMGTLLVPVSFGFIALALNKHSDFKFGREEKKLLAIGSVFLFSFWVYVSTLYKITTKQARQTLIAIEREWGAEKGLRKTEKAIWLYTRQGMVGERWYGLRNLQIVALIVLIIIWVVVIRQSAF
jgi:hypothetical protein